VGGIRGNFNLPRYVRDLFVNDLGLFGGIRPPAQQHGRKSMWLRKSSLCSLWFRQFLSEHWPFWAGMVAVGIVMAVLDRLTTHFVVGDSH
jgi:hypothetical protein